MSLEGFCGFENSNLNFVQMRDFAPVASFAAQHHAYQRILAHGNFGELHIPKVYRQVEQGHAIKEILTLLSDEPHDASVAFLGVCQIADGYNLVRHQLVIQLHGGSIPIYYRSRTRSENLESHRVCPDNLNGDGQIDAVRATFVWRKCHWHAKTANCLGGE